MCSKDSTNETRNSFLQSKLLWRRTTRSSHVQRGHKAKVLNTLKFAIDLEEGSPELYYNQKQLSDYDAMLPRIGASVTYFGTAVVRQFEQMDVFCCNSSAGISNSRDKLRCLQILSRHHIGMPKTTFVRDKKDVIPAMEQPVGGAPVVIKLIEGTQGIGVLLADTIKSAEAIIELLQSQRQNVLVQKFVAESKGRDIRSFVVGEQVSRFHAPRGPGTRVRSNVHRGGRTEGVELDPVFQETAVRAAQIMGLRVAGVDMLESKARPPKSWKSILRLAWRGSRPVPSSTWPEPSSSTWPHKSTFPRLMCSSI